MRRSISNGLRCFFLLFLLSLYSQTATAQTSASFEITSEVLHPKAPNISATIGAFGAGASLVPGGDFEPVIYRDWFLTMTDAPDDKPGRILARQSTLSGHTSLRSGALDGAQVSVMRIENGTFREVRTGQVAPDGFRVGGWSLAHRNQQILPRTTRRFSYALFPWQRPDVPMWFSVRAIERNGNLSEFSKPVQAQLPVNLPKTRAALSAPPFTSADYIAAAIPSSSRLSRPQNLKATIDASGVVNLRWDAPDSKRRLAGYVVYLSYEDPDRFDGIYIDTDSSGDPVRAGDLVILRHEFHKPIRARVLSDRLWSTGEGARLVRSRLIPFWPEEEAGKDWHLQPHEDPRPFEGAGRSHLRLNLDAGKTASVEVYNHAGTDQDFYRVLDPQRPLTLSVMLRADRPGVATFRMRGPLGREIAPVQLRYGTEWSQHVAQIQVPRLLQDEKGVGQMQLEISGPGQIDLDNLRIYPSDTAYLDYSDAEYAQLAEANLSALRTHGLIKTKRTTYDLQALLSDDGMGLGRHQVAGLPGTLAMMQRANVTPWLQIEPHFSRDEWLGFIEYLAAPFDPNTDSVEEKPWAALRVAQGQKAPWTEVFDNLYFELGNETWNRLFAPWIYPDMRDAATGRRLPRGTVYGLHQTYVAGVFRDSPWWGPSGLEDKMQFVIGGWNGFDYGVQAAEAAPTASDLLSIAAYNGGWDQNEAPPDRAPQSYFNVLNQVSQATIPTAMRHAAEATRLAQTRNRPLAVGTYEAGPGYALNGLNNARVTPEQVRAQEEVMKSRAAGVATLDSFLAERRAGFSMQNFFTYGTGPYWKSHAPWYRGSTPYPSWTLLSVLNAVGGGDMLAVRTVNVPGERLKGAKRRIDVPNAPQIAVYATRTETRMTVFAISRRVPDFPTRGDDGCTPVDITLPLRGASRVTLYRTSGAYTDHGVNGDPPPVEALSIPVGSSTDGRLELIPQHGAADCGLPAASAYIYVIDNPVFSQ